MKSTINYIMNHTKQAIFSGILIILAAVIGLMIGHAGASDEPATCWIMCKPGSLVNVRRTPDGRGQEVGFLEAGDPFRTDGVSKNGYIRALDIGEHGDAWIYCGYVVTEKPEKIGERYVCVAKNRVACRRWVDGPQIQGRGWLVNGSNVDVFFIADGWACTSRGYIQAEWLEVDPT